MRSTIICVGNRFVPADAAGPLVHDLLIRQGMPKDIECVDGGLQGLNLLPLLERGGRVVFVDAVSGFGPAGTVIVLDAATLAAVPDQDHYDHGAGIGYLLQVLPQVCDGEIPQEMILVGIEGEATPELVDRAARMSLDIARHGMRDCS